MNDVSHEMAGESIGLEPEKVKKEKPIPPDATPGWLLLRAPEILFARIAEGHDLAALVRYFVGWTLVFAAIYGGSLGFFAGGWQIPAAGAKMPATILLSLLICLPALFTFNVLLGSRLTFLQCASVLSMSAYMTSTILASFAPILLFFAISAGGHDFISLLNLMMCTIAGIFGVVLVWRAMMNLAERVEEEANMLILKIWMLIYGFVGAQMSWILRPFIGNPEQFALFRKIHSNFFVAVWDLLSQFVAD